jgi:thiamine pyrophosphate-dependent acetolactate synthase large subunit-like protein
MPQLIAAIDQALTPERRAAIAGKADGLRQRHARMRAADAQEAAKGWDASPISTARLSMELWDQIKGLDWALVSSHGFVSGWPQRLWDMTKYYQYIGAEGGYGVGYGGPAAVGAALAHREAGRIPIAIQCDGDLMCQPACLWTLAHHSIPLLMLMHNNRSWHQESMHLKRMSSRRQRGPETWDIGTVIDKPYIDFAAMARSLGVWAEGPISDPKDLPGAIARALKVVRSGKPALLDTITQMR